MKFRTVYVSKEFAEHRCTPNPTTRPAAWLNGLEVALRVFPQLGVHIPAGTPPETRVFHCTDCTVIALAPGKATR